ncbi:glycosyltransferase family 2 protein [Parasediminibacterium sp. JCM 36343]|uniref:glycosyltransferase family 2 protein n=1 Tax=Parasediminibacterium sp. JCM 36343 TaxID=3374279 RepID=UPI00397975DD
MSITPKVSVIIPNYNHAPYLTQRIDSVLNQTFQDFELIILDDCSTDNSRQIIGAYKNHPKVASVIYNEKNMASPFKQWQKGINESKSEYIWIAESDDLVDFDFLEKLLRYDADFSFSRIIDIDAEGNASNSARTWFDIFDNVNWDENFLMGGMAFFQLLKERCVISNISCLLFKKSYFLQYFEKVIGMRYCGDWLFYLLCATNGASFQYVANTTSYFRQHSQTTRWQNKDFVRPLEERLVCAAYIKKYDANNPILKNDLKRHIVNIPYKEIIDFFAKKPLMAISFFKYFFAAFIIKARQKA